MHVPGGTSERDHERGTLDHPMFLDVTTLSVDPAYVAAAARRADRGEPGHSRRGLVALAISMVLFGLLLTVAAQDTRRRAPEAARRRQELAGRVSSSTRAADDLMDRRADLIAQTRAARDARLRATRAGRDLADRLARLELAVGAVPVSGPGLEVRLDDSPDAGGPDDPNEDGRVRDRDIQEVVNALWAAGAEAVAVNGHRISALTAIREAGRAILVDYRPVTPPYVVQAVGDPDDVETGFSSSPTAARFRTFTDFYGLVFEISRAASLDLAAAQAPTLRYARPEGAA